MKIIECPRDAMQGISNFIPTKTKIDYINELLKVGFHTIDVGSFVSKKIIPQLSDTKEVLKNIDLSSSKSKLLVIVGNERGAKEAANFDEISYIGFPFSNSETFQTKNINSNIKDSLLLIDKIQNTVSNYFNISLSEMLSERRSRPLARPRQIAMYLAKKMTSRSLPEIGRRFANRDHTTVIHAVKTITRLSEQDDEMKKNISQIKSLLLEQ